MGQMPRKILSIERNVMGQQHTMGQQHGQHIQQTQQMRQTHVKQPEQPKQYKIAFLDCPTGIAGDMCLGALVSAGVPLADLVEGLAPLGLTGEYRLWSETQELGGQVATKVHVTLQPQSAPPLRTLGDITELIQGAKLPSPVVHKSLAIFQTLAAAEAAVHGSTPESVHFHEVGATDALVDIVGTCLGLHWLGVEALYCSALPTGGGTVWAAHGRLPVPAPAVLQLLAQGRVPVYGNGIDRELVTPTGAAIVVTLAQGFGPCPPLILEKVGLGAGNHGLPLPNILRLWLGDRPPAPATPQAHALARSATGLDRSHSHAPLSSDHPSADQPNPDRVHSHPQAHSHPHPPTPTQSHAHTPTTITLLQTQIDDLSPQTIAYVTEELLNLGALDVFTQAITMKKGRSGVLLSVLAGESLVDACETLIFRETSTLGIRRLVQERRILQRRIDRVETLYGSVAVKIAWDASLGSSPEQPLNIQPEYEDCATIARQSGVPWQTVHRTALQSWLSQAHNHDSKPIH